MDKIYPRGDKTLTREQCEAAGMYYCDEKTHNPPPGQDAYHAEIKEGTHAFGVTTWVCRHCGLGITGTRVIVP